MLRIAEEKDFPSIRAMAKKFFEASPYKNYPFKDDLFDEYIKSFLTPSVSKMVILNEENNGDVTGFIAFELGDWQFYPMLVAVEKALWVEPDARNKTLAKDLLGAFIFWAMKVGCPIIQLSSLTGDMEKTLDKFYKKMKFEKVESIYLRQFGGKEE